jgi:outer membrane protein assembly factor BamB
MIAYRLVVGAGVATAVISNSTFATLIAINTSTGTTKWAKAIAMGNNFGLAIDASNLFVSGSLSTAYDFGSGTITPIGTSDAFVARYVIATGALASIDHYGAASSSQGAFDVAKDVAGNTLIAGNISTSTTNELYFTKFVAGGATAWSQSFAFAQSSNGAISSISFSESGDIMIGGTFCGTVTIGPDHVGPFCSAQAPRFGSFISTLRNNTGDPLSSTILVPDAHVGSMSKAVTDGRQYATGTFSGSVTFPTELLTVAPGVGKFDGFVTASAP